ncbi:MAG: elongation factor Ts, partial [Gammaproteobacteria bacterium]|nr:elongation factor Ts [Gammaproteobacteria bacterium]
MEITAALVKELRERTGAGMMECKKALTENAGDIEAAIEHMRKTGIAKAAKKAGRVAAEGVILVAAADDGSRAVIVEVNCETDFVAKDDNFRAFAATVAQTALAGQPASVEALLAAKPAGGTETLEAVRTLLVAKLGENIGVRRLERVGRSADRLASYQHGSRIGVVVDIEGGNDSLARDVAMHIAASRPVCVSEADVPPELVAKESEILTAQAAESGKPADIVEKMVAGRLKKFYEEITLLGQPFVKDPDTTVGKLLHSHGARVLRFVRYELGEGVQKASADFAGEVMAQVR